MFLQLFGRGKSDDQTSTGESDDQEEQDRGRHYRRLAIIFVAATIPVLVGLLVVIFFLNQPATYGEQIRLRIPPGTQPGAQLRMKRQGVETEKGTGDLYVEIDVRVPDDLTDKQRETIRRAAEEAQL